MAFLDILGDFCGRDMTFLGAFGDCYRCDIAFLGVLGDYFDVIWRFWVYWDVI